MIALCDKSYKILIEGEILKDKCNSCTKYLIDSDHHFDTYKDEPTHFIFQ